MPERRCVDTLSRRPAAGTEIPTPLMPPVTTTLDTAGVLALQRRYGNRAVGRVLARQAPAAAPEVVGSFHPAPNLIVERTGSSLYISGAIQVYGSEATAARVARAEATILRFWNQSFPDGYQVSCHVRLVHMATPTAGWSDARIEMLRMAGPSNVNTLTSKMELNLAENLDRQLDWVVAHEFGHQLGLGDRYSEGILSKIRSLWGGERSTEIEPGYGGTLMGEDRGATTSQTLRDLGEENSPYYWQGDDQVRLWVQGNAGRLGGLSTATKQRMIDVLLEGWISDADVATIGRICAAVTDPAEAATLRAYLEGRLLGMTSIGQRTRVRVFISQMPR